MHYLGQPIFLYPESLKDSYMDDSIWNNCVRDRRFNDRIKDQMGKREIDRDEEK